MTEVKSKKSDDIFFYIFISTLVLGLLGAVGYLIYSVVAA
jgi:preprotein translocase subunit Sss1